LPATSASGSGLAGRYATALFELAREQDALDAVAADLDRLQTMIDESADLRRLIQSPVLSRDEQGRAVAAIAERAELHDLVGRFQGVLAHKRRLFALPAAIRAFMDLLRLHRGEVTAEVISAAPLGEAQLQAVRDALARRVGREVKLAPEVDPRLLGGLVVRMGSRMIDASLRTRLQRLELAMRGAA
jgi:F-type H+-transporting ATPase subunit delta